MFGIEGIFLRHGLGKREKSGFANRQLPIKRIRYFFGAFFRALPAGDAFFHVDITGIFLDPCRESTRFTFKIQQVAAG